jgi:hypothetical protein
MHNRLGTICTAKLLKRIVNDKLKTKTLFIFAVQKYFKKKLFFYFNYFFVFLDHFEVLILKII